MAPQWNQWRAVPDFTELKVGVEFIVKENTGMGDNHRGDASTEGDGSSPPRSNLEACPQGTQATGRAGRWAAMRGIVWVRYGAAVLAVAAALLTDEVDLLSGGFRIYLVFPPSIILATLFGGVGPGLLAIVLSCLAASFYLMEPIGRFAVAARADVGTMVLFIGGNLVLVGLCERLRRANRKALQAEAYRERAAESARQAAILKESEQRLSLAQKAGRVGIFDWNLLNGRIIGSAEREELFGRPSGDFEETYEEWAKRVHPEDFERLDSFFETWIHSAQWASNERWEYRVCPPDGQWRWIAARGQITRNSDGRAVRLIGTVQDITERKQAEHERGRLLQEAREARDAAEAANQAKEQFIAVLSHELRTPLTPVLATVMSMQDQMGLAPEARTDLALIQRNVELEAALIDDLLDVTRINSGKMILHREMMDAQVCLDAALQVCRKEIDAKDLKVSLVPPPSRSHVWADPARLQQVFWNLLRNAVKFTPQGGQIVIRFINDGSRLKIEIADTGVGILPEVIPRLFIAFEQGEKTVTRFFGGLGLGLSIAKAILEMHGGNLTVQSDGRDKGATFTVELAVAPASPVEAPSKMEARRASPTLKILLVEDHPDTLLTMAKLLMKMGHSITTATSVRNALEQTEKERFDLIVSDLGLPDGSGLDIMREAKRLYALPGIALSGFGTEEDIRASREAGFAEHLTKPVSIGALRETIQRVAPRAA